MTKKIEDSFIILLSLTSCKKTKDIAKDKENEVKIMNDENNSVVKYTERTFHLIAEVSLAILLGGLATKYIIEHNNRARIINESIYREITDLNHDGRLDTICNYNNKKLMLHVTPNGGFIATPYTLETKIIENR
jgi:hypothetical protein